MQPHDNRGGKRKKITPFFIVQFCPVLIVISDVAPPGPVERGPSCGILYCRPCWCVTLHCPLAVGKIVFYHSAGAKTCNLGNVFEDQEPDLCVHWVALSGLFLIALQYHYALLLLLALIPIQMVRARQESKCPRSQMFGEEYRKYKAGNLVLTGRIVESAIVRETIGRSSS